MCDPIAHAGHTGIPQLRALDNRDELTESLVGVISSCRFGTVDDPENRNDPDRRMRIIRSGLALKGNSRGNTEDQDMEEWLMRRHPAAR
ncbi:uncharacterized protein Dyak_GE28831 [Drosophila yakuba]|uniref:Uncharacterized protein n=1 Tax=Drosophila yakuba TaxID=7245 RepID=A0A0R1E2I0_DROYA|nr:uncharacterized protein Dyak_GE28831 [Drosophila yakuba]